MIRPFRMILLLATILCVQVANAQKEKVAELLNKAKTAKDDSSRIAHTLLAGRILRFSEEDSAMKLIVKSRAMAITAKHIPLQCATMDAIADIYRTHGEYDLCIKIADSGIALGKKHSANKEVGTLYQTAGAALTEKGDVKAAANYYHNAIKFHKAAKYDKGVAMTTTNLAGLYYLGMQYDVALQWYHKALALQGVQKDSNSMAITLTAIGQLYFETDKKDSSEFYTLKAYDILITRPLMVNTLYENVLSLYDFAYERDELDLASHWLDIADSLAISQKSAFRQSRVLACRGLIAEKQGNMPLAISLTKQSLKAAEEEGHLQVLAGTYKTLYVMYYNARDYKNALDMHVKYKAIADSLYNNETAETINDLNLKYETAEKENKIIKQEKTIAQKENRLRVTTIIASAAIIIVLLMAVLFIQRRRAAGQKLLARQQEQDIALLNALVSGEEKERTRVARELHDGLGGILAAAQMHLSTLEPNSVNDGEKLNQSARLISSAAEETRRIAHNMLPEILLRLGLNEALKEYSRTITESKLLQVEYESIEMDIRLPSSSELAIYRVVQELVNNIIKHSGATHALIQLQRHNDILAITIEDNGRGFDEKSSSKDGLGLANIKSRLNSLNGSVNIKSDNERGTSVYIEIKLSK